MNGVLFFVFIVFLFTVFFVSFISAHNKFRRRTMSWWGGILLSLILFSYLQQHTPSIPFSNINGVLENKYFQKDELDLKNIYVKTANINFLLLFGGFLTSMFVLEVLCRVTLVPEKIIALILLLLSFSSLSVVFCMILYANLSFIFFSISLGILLSIFIYISFCNKKFINIIDNSLLKKKLK